MTLRLDNLATKVSSRSLFVRVGIPVIQSETAVVALLSLPHKIPLLEIQVLVFCEFDESPQAESTAARRQRRRFPP